MLSLGEADGRRPEIVRTVATQDQGIDELLAAVHAFRAAADASGAAASRRREQARRLFEETLQARLMQAVRARALTPEEMERTLLRLASRELDPFTASGDVLRRLKL
jgi:LAO/AO transport system kinase